jgi:hypothetical protein
MAAFFAFYVPLITVFRRRHPVQRVKFLLAGDKQLKYCIMQSIIPAKLPF